jgi:hypothetical protein
LTEEERHKNEFRVRFQVIKVDPSDLRDAVVAMCPESGETTSCKELPQNGRVQCNGNPAKLVWQIQFLVKDQASMLNKNFYRVLLYSGVDD